MSKFFLSYTTIIKIFTDKSAIFISETTGCEQKHVKSDIITSFCGHLMYVETLWKFWNEAWIDPIEMFCSRYTFFLWPYMDL